MHQQPFNQTCSRREMLSRSAIGFGSLALASMLQEEDSLWAEEAGVLSKQSPHFQATAKNVIFLFMGGAPSHVDTWDPKPLLKQFDGKTVPEEIARNIPKIPRSGADSLLMASPFKFKKYGESGIEVSELFPRTAQMVDEICVLRSMNHRIPVHGPGESLTLSGSALGNRPSLGAWLTYGLGSQSKNMPGFVVFNSKQNAPSAQAVGWGPGFLPSRYQGTVVDSGKGVPFTQMPREFTKATRRKQLDFINWMNQQQLSKQGKDTELEARIDSYELSFRMQTAAPFVFDLSQESAQTHQLYGTNKRVTAPLGKQCLMARRLVEQGVRFIQIRHGGWDAHARLFVNHTNQARQSDIPVAGLLKDLKQRGLLDETLVIWGGEFGRTPTTEGSRSGKDRGRDHSPAGYSMWMAGGGIQGGQIIGATDVFGYTPVERPISINDFHATILHALGIDQHKLFFMHKNRKQIVTDFGGEVIREAFS
ncbi:hypothetical protein-putative related to sulfatases [hydrothermal vent metagenome]|uniref:Sulfatase n=2 Tax=hydrothermal vent metagenome TaxID=652676 RepID=A0A3B1DTY6_9ZZZZ